MSNHRSTIDRVPYLRLAQQRLGLLAGQGLCWMAVIGSGIEADPTRRIIFLSGVGVLGLLLLSFSLWASDRRNRADHAGTIAARIDAVVDRKLSPAGFSGNHLLDESLSRIERTVSDLRLQTTKRAIEPIGFGDSIEIDLRAHLANAMTKSGMYDPASALDGLTDDSIVVGERNAGDMVNRLDPRTLRWIESSQAEQLFLGWSLKQLREKSFLEIIHPDDRDLAREQLRTALSKGEAHGLIYRIKNARGESKAIQVNVGVRSTSPGHVEITHLRCHIADVTAKVRASRELRRRTRELTLVNQQLRVANRELEELKNRYSDLYQNTPALYFSLDGDGRISECNNTLLTSLGYRRDELIGKSYAELLPPEVRPKFRERFAEYRKAGKVEVEGLWIKSNGEIINVFITGEAILKPDGTILHSRSVAQDVTARRALEAALRDKNERLGVANAELSRKIKELDEFSHVVSHDLQEPLRTLTAFSDFLIRDYGDRLDTTGKEYVQYIVEASRRMRALIQDLLQLSRAGKVTADLSRVDLDHVIGVVKADLGELIRTKGAELEIDLDLPDVWGDRDRLVQLFMNLVSNGLKYNKADSPKVSIRQVESERTEMVRIIVQDNGIGIDPQFHSRVFQLFRRLHTRDEYEGTGAGLAICQKIVQAHGGKLWVESEPNHGSKFFVELSRPRDGLES